MVLCQLLVQYVKRRAIKLIIIPTLKDFGYKDKRKAEAIKTPYFKV